MALVVWNNQGHCAILLLHYLPIEMMMLKFAWVLLDKCWKICRKGHLQTQEIRFGTGWLFEVGEVLTGADPGQGWPSRRGPHQGCWLVQTKVLNCSRCQVGRVYARQGSVSAVSELRQQRNAASTLETSFTAAIGEG